MCGCRGGGVRAITDVLQGVNMYILFCVKRFELSYAMDIALWKCYVLLLLPFSLEKGHRQSDRYRNSLKVNVGQTSEIRGRAYFGFSGRIAIVLN